MNSCAQIAKALAAAINDDELEVDLSIEVEAEYSDTPPEISRTTAAPRLVIYGIEEGQETPLDRGGAVKATRVASVVLQCPINDSYSLEMCLAWLNDVKEAARVSVLLERWYHDGNETLTPYDSDLVNQHRQFAAHFKATYFDFA